MLPSGWTCRMTSPRGSRMPSQPTIKSYKGSLNHSASLNMLDPNHRMGQHSSNNINPKGTRRNQDKLVERTSKSLMKRRRIQDLMLTYLLMTGNNGLTESALTVASKAILILTVTRCSELILQPLAISTLHPTLIFQLQSPLSLLWQGTQLAWPSRDW
jgi:hypothetical protein